MSVGRVWLVGAGPGDPGLITVRGYQVLERAEVVLHDDLAHPALLQACPEAKVVNVGKRYGQPSPTQEEINSQIIEYARAGKRVVRLKGGDPLLFARGGEEAQALAEAGIPFEIVPGISSPVATSAYAGIALTHRGLSSSVTFITGSDRQGVEWSPESWKRLATATDTLCILMGMRRIEAIAEALVEGGRAAATPCAVIHWGARPEQRVVVGTLATIGRDVRAANITNPSVIVVGEVVKLRQSLRWFDNRPLFGKRILVPRAKEQSESTARAVRDRGAEPFVLPLIEVAPPDDFGPADKAIRELASYDWVLFASAHATERFLQRIFEQGQDSRVFGAARLGAVGPKTAASLERYGLRADLVASEFVGDELGRELLAAYAPKRVLIPRAKVARELLPELLRERGVVVDTVEVYQTKKLEGPELVALVSELEEGRIDAVLLTSGSVVDSLVAALGERYSKLLASVALGSIGPVTSEALARHGLAASVTASSATIDGLLDALAEYSQGK